MDNLSNGNKNDEFIGLRQTNSSELDYTESEVLNVKELNLAKQNKLSEALQCFEKAVHLNPNNGKAWYNYGTGLTRNGESNEEAIHCFEKAIEMKPNDAEACNNKVSVLHIMGKNKEAIVCYKRAVELASSNGKAWQNLGLLLEKLGDKKAAKECFKMAAQTRK